MQERTKTTHQFSGTHTEIDGGATIINARMQQIPIPTNNITTCSLPEDLTTGVFQLIANITMMTVSIINAMLAIHIETIDHPLL